MRSVLLLFFQFIFGSVGLAMVVGSFTSALWGLAFVTAKSFGLEVQSWFWVFAGPPLVAVMAGLLLFCGSLMFSINKSLEGLK